MPQPPSVALIDWGTSSFRLWLLGRDGMVLERRASAEGMRHALTHGFGAILEDHLAAAGAGAETPVVLCGMAGAKGAWAEAGYIDLPAQLEGIAGEAVSVSDASRYAVILPGLAKRAPGAADVIRGEETILLGASLRSPESAARLYCLPGTHSKWIDMDGSEVRSFRTYMTGELFDVIASHSIISQSVDAGEAEPQFSVDGIFGEAVRTAAAHPERFTNLLFGIRASAILSGTDAVQSREALSGYLIGTEMAGELNSARGNGPVALIAAGILMRCYEAAFQALNVSYEPHDAEALVLAGLSRAAQTLGLIDAMADTGGGKR